jgi:hypothetical protein
MSRYATGTLFCLLTSLLLTTNLFAGWVITEKTTNSLGNSSTQTTFIQNNKVRFEGQTSIAVFDINTQKLIMIFPQYKVYWEGTAKEFSKSTTRAFENQLLQMVAKSTGETKELYKKMYEDFKKQLQTGANDSAKLDVKINATGKTDTILKHTAKEYQVVVNDSLKEYIWVTDEINPYDEIDYKKMIEFTKALNPYDTESAITASEPYVNLISKGMVLKSVEKHRGIEVVTEVTMIKHLNFNDDIFNAPPNYRKSNVTEIMQMAPEDQHINPEDIERIDNGNGIDGFEK